MFTFSGTLRRGTFGTGLEVVILGANIRSYLASFNGVFAIMLPPFNRAGAFGDDTDMKDNLVLLFIFFSYS